MLTLENLQQLWPNADAHHPGLLEAIAEQAPVIFPLYGLNDDLTIAHAMAQFSVETTAGTQLVESLNYSAQALLTYFPDEFTAETAATYARNEKQIGIIAYGHKLGNQPAPAEDGWTFRGRGLSQVTGRASYTNLSTAINNANPGADPIDLVNNPDLILDPQHTLECAVADFCMCGCLACAEKDNCHDVTRALNGPGLVGLTDREAWLTKWKNALGVATLAV